MSIKAKLGMGIITASLGLSLIGGGTYAYFNDAGSSIQNSFASGTINLNATKAWDFPANFDLVNMKPGDVTERQFVLQNIGSLDIANTLMSFTSDAGSDAGLLNTLTISYFVSVGNNNEYLLMNSQDITLSDAIAGNYAGKIKAEYLTADGKLNLTPDGIKAGAGVDDHRFRMMVKFPETNVPQNDLQGKQAHLTFNFDARQGAGTVNNQNIGNANPATIANPITNAN
ncbi:camelysin [Paenibacillus taihuensis]|uniref:Camelysin n=1 Tax=Paenibacillus taihuensis TaxID=1156355 RepID=A0A3D9SB88_9BACL|nr:TasA family protein [Paenibacillus taihuensis]REE90554.1 camelysin [Paenibacillus taihuensis]